MWGYLGLTVAFVLLASMLLWLVIYAKAPVILKGILIAFVMWYGLVLYYTPNNIMGWPTDVSSFSELPPGAFLMSAQVREPNKKTKDAGAIFFTLITPDESKNEFTINPKKAFTYKGKTDPRIYKVPYSEELHKKLLAAQKGRDAKKGSMIRIGGGVPAEDENKGRGQDTLEDVDGDFKIINPYELLEKHQ